MNAPIPQNTAITSGSALGQQGGAGGPGGANVETTSLLNLAGSGLSNAFAKDGESNFGAGFSLQNTKGLLGMTYDTALKPGNPLSGFFDIFESKEGMFKATESGNNSSNASGGGTDDSSKAHATFDAAAEKFGGSGARNMGEGGMGPYSPDNTPMTGRSRGIGQEGGIGGGGIGG